MMGNGFGGRDDYFVATTKTAQGAAAYDPETGILTSGGDVTTVEFYGKIMDMPSEKLSNGRKYRDVSDFVVECDSVDVEELNADYTVKVDGSDDIYSVVDVYEYQYKFVSHVLLKHIR